MMICKDCKHWNIPRPGDTHGSCELTLYQDGAPKYGYASPAFASDGEMYFAILNTHPTFGCILGVKR